MGDRSKLGLPAATALVLGTIIGTGVFTLAFSYWMIIGAETVYKGLLMVLAGVPVYVWMLSSANRRRSGEPSVIPRA